VKTGDKIVGVLIFLVIILGIVIFINTPAHIGNDKNTPKQEAVPTPVPDPDELILTKYQAIYAENRFVGATQIYHDRVNNATVYIFTGSDGYVVGGSAIKT
jgi:hypothetical protein